MENSVGISPLLHRVEALVPEIAARADETERQRAVPGDIMAKLRDAGLFRMMIPRSLGGEELDHFQACRVIETLARADGSAGWNAQIIFGFNVALGRFPAHVIEKVVGASGDVMVRGALAPLGRAAPSDGGFTITGRWPFASGSFEPEWVVASALIIEEGKSPQLLANGSPDMCMALVPARSVEFLDTWYTVGLCGSASNDFRIAGAFVPSDHVTNVFDPDRPSAFGPPLLQFPFSALSGPTHSAVVIGIAQGALHDLTTLARSKRSAFNQAKLLGEDPVAQHQIGQLGARLHILRTALVAQVRETMHAAGTGMDLTAEFLARGAALIAHTHTECVAIVNEAFALAGSVPVYRTSALQRRWRDVRCAAQHYGASPAAFQRLGSIMVSGQAPPRF